MRKTSMLLLFLAVAIFPCLALAQAAPVKVGGVDPSGAVQPAQVLDADTGAGEDWVPAVQLGYRAAGGLQPVDASTPLPMTDSAASALLLSIDAYLALVSATLAAPLGPISASFVTVGGDDGIQSRPLRLNASGALTIAALQLPPALGSQVQTDSLSVVPSSASKWTADSELPAAAALGDAIANPTAPMVGAAGMLWDGAQWLRAPGSSGGGARVSLYMIAGNTVNAGAGADSTGTQRVVEASRDGTAFTTGSIAQGAGDVTIASRSGRKWALVQNADADGALCVVLGASTTGCTKCHPLNAANAAGEGGASWLIEDWEGAVSFCAPDAGTTITYNVTEVY